MHLIVNGVFSYSFVTREMVLLCGDKSASTVGKWFKCIEFMKGMTSFKSNCSKEKTETVAFQSVCQWHGDTLESMDIQSITRGIEASFVKLHQSDQPCCREMPLCFPLHKRCREMPQTMLLFFRELQNSH